MAMEPSILKSTKKILGIAEDYTPFDLDILTFINSSLSTLSQIGIPETGFVIEDDTQVWSELDIPNEWLSQVKTFIFLNVKMLFDPPPTSFALDAGKGQIEEHLTRLSYLRENALEDA